MKLHTGDTVVIISGKDKGKTGTIIRTLPNENRVVVSGVNVRTRHIPRTYQEAGRIVKFEASIHASNVMIVDPKTKKRTRIGYKVEDKGGKKRIAKVSGEVVVKVKPKAAPKTKADKDMKDMKKAKTAKEATPSHEEQQVTDGKSAQPFWKRMKFGSAAQSPDMAEAPRSEQDHSVPKQQHTRSSGRGS